MAEVTYQTYDAATDEVGGASVVVDEVTSLSHAREIAVSAAGGEASGVSVDVVSAVTSDGRDLITEWEYTWRD